MVVNDIPTHVDESFQLEIGRRCVRKAQYEVRLGTGLNQVARNHQTFCRKLGNASDMEWIEVNIRGFLLYIVPVRSNLKLTCL